MKKLLFSITALSLTFYTSICMAESAADQMHSANIDGLAATKYYKEVHEGEAKELTELKSPAVHEAGKDNRGKVDLNGDLEKMRTEAGYNFDTKSPIKKEPIGTKIVDGYVYEKNGRRTEMYIGGIPPVSEPEDVTDHDRIEHPPVVPPKVIEIHGYIPNDDEQEEEIQELNIPNNQNNTVIQSEKNKSERRKKNYRFGEGKDNPSPRTIMEPAPEATTPSMNLQDDISYWCDALKHQNDSDEECRRCCMENVGEMNGYGKCGGHLDENHVCQCDWVQQVYTGPEAQYPSIEAQCCAEYPDIYTCPYVDEETEEFQLIEEDIEEFSFSDEDMAKAKAKTEADEAKYREEERKEREKIRREDAQKCGLSKNHSDEHCKLCCYSSYFEDANYNPKTQKISDAKLQNGSCVCYWENREFNPCESKYSVQSDQNCTQCCFSKFFHNDNFDPNTQEMTHGKVVNGDCRCWWDHKETEEEKAERERREEEQRRLNEEFSRQLLEEAEEARRERDAEWDRRWKEYEREREREEAEYRRRQAEEERREEQERQQREAEQRQRDWEREQERKRREAEDEYYRRLREQQEEEERRQREWEEQQEALRRKQEEALRRVREEAGSW